MGTPKTRRTRKAAPEMVEPLPVVDEVAPAAALTAPKRVDLKDLWEMRAGQLEKRAADAEAEVARISKLYVLNLLDPKGRVLALEKKLETAQKQAERAETKALLAKKRIEGLIGRSLANVAIDPDTGEIIVP